MLTKYDFLRMDVKEEKEKIKFELGQIEKLKKKISKRRKIIKLLEKKINGLR